MYFWKIIIFDTSGDLGEQVLADSASGVDLDEALALAYFYLDEEMYPNDIVMFLEGFEAVGNA